MISEYYATKYCSDNISLIANYHQAIADSKRMWDIHHRKECDANGRTLFSKKQLIDMKLYFNRPASELMFVTRSMHRKIHRELCEKCGKIGGKLGGKIGGGNANAAIAAKLATSIPILQFSKDGTLVKEWQSTKEAGRQLGIAQSSICHCLKKHYKSAGGYVWKYK